MKEIVVISGKGGTGKTSISSALAFIEPDSIVLADCDVDAADLHLILKPQVTRSEDFYSGYKAVIDNVKCVACGLCHSICRFSAIIPNKNAYKVNSLDCEGCGYCARICLTKAISMHENLVGESYASTTRTGSPMMHARLKAGADNSGKLVAKVKNMAKASASEHNLPYVLIDGSPGIGCPVISSLSGASLALIVTEPSLSALSDMKRVWELATKFNLPCAIIINKADINPSIAGDIAAFASLNNITIIDSLPYDNDFYRAVTLGQSLVEYNPAKWQPRYAAIWNKLKELV